MRSSAEFSIDFSAEELLQESGPAQATKPTAHARSGTQADATPAAAGTTSPTTNDDDSIEIELTPEQIDALQRGSLAVIPAAVIPAKAGTQWLDHATA